jgi:hypothetical protein
MKTKVNSQKLSISLLMSNLSKKFVMLFESGSKKDFHRLKNFISS